VREVLSRDAEVRYRYPYQMRHTYVSMMLSAGENPAWIARQWATPTGE
jgi:integrase